MAASYEVLGTVVHDGVRLSHKVRTDSSLNFKCLTWRQQRASSGTNRRFYLEQGEFWTLPLSAAQQMLRQASDAGFFKSRGERWPGTMLQMIDSAELRIDARAQLSAEILTRNELDELWHGAPDARFLVGVEPGGLWRKALIFSEKLGLATLRSLTLDRSYSFTYSFPLASGWMIDKSMLDADAEIHEFFLARLQFPKPR